MSRPKLKPLAASMAFLALAAVIVWQQLQARRLMTEMAMLREQVEQGSALREENQRLAERLQAASERAKADSSELLRLRAQSGRMRQTEQENTRLRTELDRRAKEAQSSTPQTQEPATPETPEVKLRLAKLTFGRALALALLMAADNNDQNLPTEMRGPLFDGLESPAADTAYRIQLGQFELVYKGSLREVKDPSETILAREKEPFQQADGRWMKLYLFADGSSRFIAADTRDGFPAKEEQLWPKKSPP